MFSSQNCYGWNGPWQHRSGWQQISDAVSLESAEPRRRVSRTLTTFHQCCGVSREYGRAMGNEEAVTPVFPNSDYCTGVSGCIGVMQALIRRSEEGGSYAIDVSAIASQLLLTLTLSSRPR